MALTVTDRLVRSPDTRHTASRHRDTWHVSWLPGVSLTHAQAISAMLIAQAAGRGVGLSDDPLWPHIEEWAGELGMSGAAAVARASEPPPETAR